MLEERYNPNSIDSNRIVICHVCNKNIKLSEAIWEKSLEYGDIIKFDYFTGNYENV